MRERERVNDPDERLAALGLALPEPAPPVASFLPWRRSGGTIYVSGQIATTGGRLLHEGRVGETVGLEQAQECARACALNALAQLHAAAAGDLKRIDQLVKVTVFVASTPDFASQHLVANGASDLLIEVFGERGGHARSAIGVAALPLGSPVEVELVAQALAEDDHSGAVRIRGTRP